MAFEHLIKDKESENYHPNPAVRAARAKLHATHSKEHPAKPEHDGHGPVTETSVVKHRDGTAHVRAKHEDGHEAIHHHPNEAAAHEHAKALMANDGEQPEGITPGTDTPGENEEANAIAGEAAAEGESPEHEGAEHEAGEEGEEDGECPECGHEMEDGKCPNCGYEKEEEKEGEE